jgi:hypothetical protein
MILKKAGCVRFALKVWLTSVVITTPLLALTTSYHDYYEDGTMNFFRYWVFYILFGSIFSFPSMVIFLFLANIIRKQDWSIIQKKGTLILSGIILTVAPFYILTADDMMETDTLQLIIAYATTITAGILLYRLSKKPAVTA